MRVVGGAAASIAALALSGCSLIDLEGLSTASGGAGSTATSASTSSPTTAASTTTASTATATSNATSNATTDASSSGSGCRGPTYCETSAAQFCDDFDTEASRAAWSENVAVQPGTDYELAFVASPALSCPYSAKTALLDPGPDDTYVQWYRAYTPQEPYDSVSLAFSARKEETAINGPGIIASLIYGVSTGEFCEVLLHDDGAGVGVYVQRIFAGGGAMKLGEGHVDIVPDTIGTWVDHEIYVDSDLGTVEVEYRIRRENGAIFEIPLDDMEDAACGEGMIDSDVHLKLGSNYVGEAPSVTFFDDVEFEFDP